VLHAPRPRPRSGGSTSDPGRANLPRSQGGERTELDRAPVHVLRWGRWDVGSGGAPQDVVAVEFFAAGTDPEALGASAATAGGPCLRLARVAPLHAVIYAHGKANDDHVKVIGGPWVGREALAVSMRGSVCLFDGLGVRGRKLHLDQPTKALWAARRGTPGQSGRPFAAWQPRRLGVWV
jgi:hypothetical protein